MTGYSATPLTKKLGIKPGTTLFVINEPELYWDWLSPLPDGIEVVTRPSKGSVDFIHHFAKDTKSFEKHFTRLKGCMKKEGMLWISWPKKSSALYVDLDENKIRNVGLKQGLVDVKVCAVDETWSGLKFVFRLKDR